MNMAAPVHAISIAKAMIVDDDQTNRLFLRALLRKEGYAVVEAADGAEAVQYFRDVQPDIVFMDVMMPNLDGYEATRRIKALAGDRFVPVIFLTALTDEAALARCVEAGGDDFLSKPYKQDVLKSRIVAIERIRALYNRIQRQNDELRLLQARRARDDEIAQRVFADALAGNSTVLSGVHSLLRPAAAFNGDLLLAAYRPGGGLNLMLGDFTGHGLGAAIWALPVAETFRAMSTKGFGLPDIMAQVNHKLCGLLPKDVFLSACVVSLDKELREAEIWNGGMPDVLVVDGASGRIRARVLSRHLPLGIAREIAGADGFDHVPLTPGDRIVMCSDGLIEARNRVGEEFGDARLDAVVEAASGGSAYSAILAALDAFCDQAAQDDDISLVEIPCVAETIFAEARSIVRPPVESDHGTSESACAWQWSLELHAPSLRSVDPVPLAISQLQQLPGLSTRSADLYTVLSELYTNALYHGVLQLDSALKLSSDGFERYYTLRDERLNALQEGHVRIELEYQPLERGGRLCVRVEDTGAGFDPSPYLEWRVDSTALSGRGIGLVRSLCQSLSYAGCGNRAEAVYVWSD